MTAKPDDAPPPLAQLVLAGEGQAEAVAITVACPVWPALRNVIRWIPAAAPASPDCFTPLVPEVSVLS